MARVRNRRLWPSTTRGRYLLAIQFASLIVGIVLLFEYKWRAVGAFLLVVSVSTVYINILLRRREKRRQLKDERDPSAR